jgi:hypothetical protein
MHHIFYLLPVSRSNPSVDFGIQDSDDLLLLSVGEIGQVYFSIKFVAIRIWIRNQRLRCLWKQRWQNLVFVAPI